MKRVAIIAHHRGGIGAIAASSFAKGARGIVIGGDRGPMFVAGPHLSPAKRVLANAARKRKEARNG